ncbi:flippase [Solirubrobacter taibaiensis]|nr:flippase [Solirubrobacter taibaiensis]
MARAGMSVATANAPEPPDSPHPPDLLDTPEAGGAAIRGGAVRLVGYGVALILGLAATPLLVRHLGVVDFGRYTLVLSLMALVQGVTEGGLSAIGLREYSVLGERARRDLMRQLLGLRVLLTVLGVAGAVAFTLIAGYDSEIVVGTVVAGGGLLTLVLFSLVSIPLAAELRLGWVTVAEVARAAIMAALIVVLALAGAGLVPFLALQIPAGVVSLAIVLVLVRRLIPLRPSLDLGRWWELARATLPYAAAIAISAIYFRITIILMSLVSSDQETGYFAVSYRVIEVLVGVPTLLAGAAFPILSRAARDDPARLRYSSQRTLDMMLMSGVWVALVIALTAPFVIQVLAGDDSEPSVGTLQIQAAALACTFVAVPCGYILLALRRHRAILLGNLAPLTLGVVLTLVLAPEYGAQGAAVATVIAELGLAAALLWFARRGVPFSLKGFGAIAIAAAPAAGAGILVLAVAHPLLAATAATLIYLLMLLALRQFPPELMIAVRSRTRRQR